MSGSKVKAAISNLLHLFKTHINAHDQIMLIHFDSKVHSDVELQTKSGNEVAIESKIASLSRPNGSTALYDAIMFGIHALNRAVNNADDWVIVLTDGADTASTNKFEFTKSAIAKSSIGLIIIGVGEDLEGCDFYIMSIYS